jgi:hypothetical protein
MVAGVGYGRKKKKVCRGERKAGRRRESHSGCLVVGWWLCWLSIVELVVEELVVVWFEGWNDGDREGQKWQKTRGSGWFFINFGLIFLMFRP